MDSHLVVSGDRVRTILLDRPEKHNALSEELFRELVGALQCAQADASVRAVVLGSSGRNFCAGGDLDDFLASYDAPLEDGYAAIPSGMELFSLGFRLRKPLVVAVKGSSRGGGVGLAALGHITVAQHDATFALTELKLGLFPYGIFPLLVKNMGSKRALELALSTRVIDAKQAQTYGLIDEVVDDSLARAQEIASGIASASAYSVESGIELYNSIADTFGDTTFAHAGVLRLLAFKSDELAARVKGFLDARH